MNVHQAMHRVLVVDDDQIEMEMLVELLSAPNRVVDAFGSAASALEFLQDHPIDLALLDQVMPGMTGTELAGRIKGLYPQARIVICTGYLVDSTQRKGQGNVDHVFLKPLKLGEILELTNADAAR